MQGLFVTDPETGYERRPRSKKEVREILALAGPEDVYVEATSLFGDELDGYLSGFPENTKVYFVGPDPYTKRNFYGSLSFDARKGWTVK